jgi:peptide chain release factor 1
MASQAPADSMTSSPGVTALLEEHAGLEARLADPDVHADQALARSLGRRYAALAPVVATVEELRGAEADLADARELAREDPAFAAEATELEAQVGTLRDRLSEQLVPRDAADANDVVVEVKSGEGGEESALFAGDLLRMYSRYAERRGWKVEVLSATESDLGGYKDVTVTVTAPGNDADGVWAWLKYEGGVHRVQRVPVTESQGRIHTSAAGVLVYPEVDAAADVEIDEKDLRVDVFRSSGKGGQGVNTTDSAVRITHLPTGVVVSCQAERSQLQNKARAMDVLRSRLQAIADEAEAAQASADRRSQVRTVDRSERVRTYNYPENRISDHRVGYKSHDLDRVLDGDLDAVLDALRAADRAERMARSGPSADEPRS